jgi:PPOX class probable F420-dependent enzyme
MPSRRDSIKMTPEEVEAFLDVARTMNVATIGPDGRPHLVAMWYGFFEGKPAFWTFGKSQKIMNLKRDPRITALCEEGATYSTLKGVELVGTGRIIEDRESIIAIARSTSERHNGPESIDETSLAFLAKQAEKRVGVVIEVEKIVSWDHTKLAGAY